MMLAVATHFELLASGAALAYVPFKTPINALHEWWYLLLIPLALGIALIYKALRVEDLRTVWMQTALMTAQVILAMIALAAVLALFVLVVIPRLPVP